MFKYFRVAIHQKTLFGSKQFFYSTNKNLAQVRKFQVKETGTEFVNKSQTNSSSTDNFETPVYNKVSDRKNEFK